MRSFRIGLFLLTLGLPTHTLWAQTPPEVAQASQALQKLHFFEDGRGMHLSPGVLEFALGLRKPLNQKPLGARVDRALLHRWGIQEHKGQWVGLHSVRYREHQMGVLGCVACHSGKAAGQYIVGIGNKNIDPGQIGKDGLWIQKLHRLVTRAGSAEARELELRSIRLMAKLNDLKLKSETQGLVPVSLVGSWFYEQAGQSLPTHGYKGGVKVPSWFGFGEKMKVGQFADAIGAGHPPGWIIGVEITSGQTAETVRSYQHKIQEAADWISKLQPPRFPGPINTTAAARGKTLFLKTCAGCHGEYQTLPDGTAQYSPPKVIDWFKVGTDTDRLDYVTDDFLNVVRTSPLRDLIQLSEHAGQRRYVAPRLHAIWARFPYLHNASVPTLSDLLNRAAERPKKFSLRDAGEAYRYDPVRMGLKPDRAQLSRPARWVYDTAKQGQSNQGHEKGVDLPAADKLDLLEYLKTL